MKRHDVHLSEQVKATMEVARRYGTPVLLKIRAKEMHQQGHRFVRSANGVWLTESVPPEFLEFPEPS
jgi:putative RNA 2'-phosphotransferase